MFRIDFQYKTTFHPHKSSLTFCVTYFNWFCQSKSFDAFYCFHSKNIFELLIVASNWKFSLCSICIQLLEICIVVWLPGIVRLNHFAFVPIVIVWREFIHSLCVRECVCKFGNIYAYSLFILCVCVCSVRTPSSSHRMNFINNVLENSEGNKYRTGK